MRRSWIKIRAGVIIRYSDGPINLPSNEGWIEVSPGPARNWRLVAGVPTLKTQAELEAEAQPRIKQEQDDRQRIGNKIQTMLTDFEGGNQISLRKFLTKIVLKFRDLED